MPDFATLRLAWEPRMSSILRINRGPGKIHRRAIRSRKAYDRGRRRVARLPATAATRGARIIVGEIITSAISQTVLTKSVNQFAE